MNKFKLKQSAFTLIELMLAIVILGALSVSIAMGFTNLFQQKSQSLTKSQVHNIQSALSTYLHNNASCSAELSGKPLPDASWSNLNLTNYRGFGDYVGTLEKGSDLGKMKIEELRIRKKPGSLTDSFNDGVVGYRIYIMQIQVQFRLDHLGSKVFAPFYIELPVFSKSPYNQIDSCYSGVKLPYFCSALGLSYDAAKHACSPQYRCLLRGFYSTESCSGRTSCKSSSSARLNPVTNSYSCPSGVTPIQIGLYTNNYTEGCGKKCTRTVQRRVKSYLCMDCN